MLIVLRWILVVFIVNVPIYALGQWDRSDRTSRGYIYVFKNNFKFESL